MRFIIREQDFETPLASGLFRYEKDNRETGVVEDWRLTKVAVGYRFLRVDIDGRDSARKDSSLYHFVLNPSWRPERLKFRYYSPNKEVFGDVLLENEAITITREINGLRFEDSITNSAETDLWFPSIASLGLLAHRDKSPEQFKAIFFKEDDDFTPVEGLSQISKLDAGEFTLGREFMTVHRYKIRGQEQELILGLDKFGWPVIAENGDGWRAIETRYIRYYPDIEEK